MTFVHWRYRPATIDRLLPDGVVADTFDGAAWVGLTPFRMQASMLPVVAQPSVLAGEVNLRTYVKVADSHGLWFLSLEIDKSLVASSLRAILQLPYRSSRIAMDRRGDLVDYSARRRHGDDEVHLDLSVVAGKEVPEGAITERDVFLLARWRAFTEAYGRMLAVPVEHRSWPLRTAELTHLDTNLLESAGLPPPEEDPVVAFSEGVHARLGFPRPATR